LLGHPSRIGGYALEQPPMLAIDGVDAQGTQLGGHFDYAYSDVLVGYWLSIESPVQLERCVAFEHHALDCGAVTVVRRFLTKNKGHDLRGH